MGSDELISSVPNFARGLDILLVDHETASLMYLASLLEQYSFKGIYKKESVHLFYQTLFIFISKKLDFQFLYFMPSFLNYDI